MPTRYTFDDDGTLATVIDALRREADRRQRVALTLATEVEADRRAGSDVRSSAVRIARFLADVAALTGVAADLEHLAGNAGTDTEAAAAPTTGEEVDDTPVAGRLVTGTPGRAPARIRTADEPAPTEDDLAEALAALDMETDPA